MWKAANRGDCLTKRKAAGAQFRSGLACMVLFRPRAASNQLVQQIEVFVLF
jgi:hypothetical protein